MRFLLWIKNLKLWHYLAVIVVVLLGLVKVQKYRNTRLERDKELLKKQSRLQKATSKVEQFEAVNKTKKESVDEKTESFDGHLNPSSTYSV